MLTQLPLPLLPAAAEEIAPGVGVVTGPDGGLVCVHGLATFAWDAGDEAARRLAAVQLVRLRAAGQAQVAAAFGVDPATIWRWDQALSGGGLAGLVPARTGPKRPSKLTPELVARIAGLDAAGCSLREIARVTGVSAFSVRNALGRVPAAAGAVPGEPDAGSGRAGLRAGEGAAAGVPGTPDEGAGDRDGIRGGGAAGAAGSGPPGRRAGGRPVGPARRGRARVRAGGALPAGRAAARRARAGGHGPGGMR